MFHLGESPMIVHLPGAVTFESREYIRSDELGLLLGHCGIVEKWNSSKIISQYQMHDATLPPHPI